MILITLLDINGITGMAVNISDKLASVSSLFLVFMFFMLVRDIAGLISVIRPGTFGGAGGIGGGGAVGGGAYTPTPEIFGATGTSGAGAVSAGEALSETEITETAAERSETETADAERLVEMERELDQLALEKEAISARLESRDEGDFAEFTGIFERMAQLIASIVGIERRLEAFEAGGAMLDEIRRLRGIVYNQKAELDALLLQIKEFNIKRIDTIKQEIDADKKAAEAELKKASIVGTAERLGRRAAKKQAMIESMTHDERIKELASKARNFTAMLFKAEKGRDEKERARMKTLADAIIAGEGEEYKDETEMENVLKEMHDAISQITTAPAAGLSPEENKRNIQLWAQIHACMQKLGLLESDMRMKAWKIKKMKEELLPLMTDEVNFDEQVKLWQAWLKNVEDAERQISEEDRQRAEEAKRRAAERRAA